MLLASGEATTRKAVAQRLHVERQTVARWLERYRERYRERGLERGLEHLLTPGTPGPRPGQRTLPEPVLEALKERLASPEGFAGFHKVQHWLHEAFGLEVPYKSVYTLVRYRLKAKLKVPRPEHPKKA